MAATNPYRHRHILTNTHRTLVNFAFCVSMHHRVHRTVLRHAVDFARTHATSALATVPVLLRFRVGAGEGAGSRGAAAGVRDRRHTCPEVHMVVRCVYMYMVRMEPRRAFVTDATHALRFRVYGLGFTVEFVTDATLALRSTSLSAQARVGVKRCARVA